MHFTGMGLFLVVVIIIIVIDKFNNRRPRT
jgi:hypothetical protein